MATHKIVKYSGPVNCYVFVEDYLSYTEGTNIQDQNDTERWEELEALITADPDLVEDWENTAEYAAAVLETAKADEREWRDEELARVDVEIYKLEDAVGDASSWRTYRQALRDWPADGNFPDTNYRPVSP